MLKGIYLLSLVGVTVMMLNACRSNSVTTTQRPPAAPAAEATATAPVPTVTAAQPSGSQHGGQVVEMGDYHLELLAAPEGDRVHIDFWLLTGSDYRTIADARVTANIQFPNGTQKQVELTYYTTGQHYKALVPGFVAGEYRVVVQTDMQGKMVNGRFNFRL